MKIRVMIWAIEPADAPGSVEAAYHQISGALVGTPGLLGNQLMRSIHDPSRFVVVSEWSSRAEYDVWERDPIHKPTTAPMRSLQDPDRRPMVYEKIAAYDESGPLMVVVP
jgi:heme-degrading monooxygenase HmoA